MEKSTHQLNFVTLGLLMRMVALDNCENRYLMTSKAWLYRTYLGHSTLIVVHVVQGLKDGCESEVSSN